ncbi:hypothetical protein [Streptomyces apocyni]|uniref:hypothetical protein n=1 Tax=Streptomyces apocyni TaxID=2654677 RepID=UPI0012E9A655|nr:hypothetical protein [Streptomyces apocyni]
MAHAAPSTRRVSIHASTWGLPLLLGIVYGVWTAGIERSTAEEPITTGNVLFGVVTGVLFALGVYALRTVSPRLQRELRAIAWASFAGVTFGFLYSLSGRSVLRCTIMALAIAGVVFAVRFYRYYTSED